MPNPLPLPIRVLVKGDSMAVYLSEADAQRSDFAFGRVIEEELLRAGRPAEVRVLARPAESARRSLRTWEEQVLGWSPDVVILHYGRYETIHLFLPRWLERHANSSRFRRGPIRDVYRRKLLRSVWITLAKLQSRVDARFGSGRSTRRPRRFAADLTRLIEEIQRVGSPLVIVMEILSPARKWRSWMPGLDARTRTMNRTLAALVRAVDKPNVRYFTVSDIINGQLDADEEPNPDGGHYSSKVHRLIGRALSAEIMSWANTQEHLRTVG